MTDNRLLMIVRAIRYYLVTVEGRDFGEPRKRSGPPQIKWDQAARTLVADVFGALRAHLPTTPARMIEAAYEMPLLAAEDFVSEAPFSELPAQNR